MKRSERINLIQEIVTAMSQMPPEIGDLTLGEFGLPTHRQWDLGPESYYISMVRDGTDEVLRELAAHLKIPSTALAVDPDADRRLWKPGSCRCFLSHTAKHKHHATGLKTELESYGCDVFVAHEDIVPILEWRREIENALGSCHCLIALLTEDFHTSLWTDHEVGFVLGRGLPVIPIRAGLDPYGLKGKIQGVPFNPKSLGDVAETVFAALNSKPQTSTSIANGAVQAFLESTSYAMAKKRMGVVERVAGLTPELREQLRGAVAANNQIADAFGVPGRIASLVDQPEW